MRMRMAKGVRIERGSLCDIIYGIMRKFNAIMQMVGENRVRDTYTVDDGTQPKLDLVSRYHLRKSTPFGTAG